MNNWPTLAITLLDVMYSYEKKTDHYALIKWSDASLHELQALCFSQNVFSFVGSLYTAVLDDDEATEKLIKWCCVPSCVGFFGTAVNYWVDKGMFLMNWSCLLMPLFMPSQIVLGVWMGWAKYLSISVVLALVCPIHICCLASGGGLSNS